jgi:hypothetical protein
MEHPMDWPKLLIPFLEASPEDVQNTFLGFFHECLNGNFEDFPIELVTARKMGADMFLLEYRLSSPQAQSIFHEGSFEQELSRRLARAFEKMAEV